MDYYNDNSFVDPNTGIPVGNHYFKQKEGVYYFSGPKTLDYAKEHYQCDSIDGIPLENGGGEGTADYHWEQ